MTEEQINEYADNVVSDLNELEKLQDAEELLEEDLDEPVISNLEIMRKVALHLEQTGYYTFQDYVRFCSKNNLLLF